MIEAEARLRDKAVERVGLGIDLKRGKATRYERQLVGVAGEAAVWKAIGGNVSSVQGHGKLDGGIDVRVMGLDIQVKASVHMNPRWVYASKKGRIRADVIVQTAAGMSLWSHRICGWRIVKEHLQLLEDADIGGDTVKAMSTSKLYPIAEFIELLGRLQTTPSTAIR